MKRSVYISLIMTGLLIAVPAAAQTSLLPGSVSCSGTLGQCIQTLYRFGVGATAILAVIVIMWGGFVWLTSGGNVSRIESAKEWIYGAVLGLVLALTSFLLLNTINPQLTTISISGSATPISTSELDNPDNDKCCVLTNNTTGKSNYGVISKLIAGEDCSNLKTANQDARLCTPSEEITFLNAAQYQDCTNVPCNPGHCLNRNGLYYKLQCTTTGQSQKSCIFAGNPVDNSTCTIIYK